MIPQLITLPNPLISAPSVELGGGVQRINTFAQTVRIQNGRKAMDPRLPGLKSKELIETSTRSNNRQKKPHTRWGLLLRTKLGQSHH